MKKTIPLILISVFTLASRVQAQTYIGVGLGIQNIDISGFENNITTFSPFFGFSISQRIYRNAYIDSRIEYANGKYSLDFLGETIDATINFVKIPIGVSYKISVTEEVFITPKISGYGKVFTGTNDTYSSADYGFELSVAADFKYKEKYLISLGAFYDKGSKYSPNNFINTGISISFATNISKSNQGLDQLIDIFQSKDKRRESITKEKEKKEKKSRKPLKDIFKY